MMLPALLLTGKAKLIAGGLLLAGLYWYHQHALAVVYSEAAQEATEAVLQQQAEAMKQKQAAFDAQMALERDEIEGQRMVLAAERAALSGQRRELLSSVNAQIIRISEIQRENLNETLSIPASAVRPAIRSTLAELRAGPESANRN